VKRPLGQLRRRLDPGPEIPGDFAHKLLVSR
jgi:hypothetical protein